METIKLAYPFISSNKFLLIFYAVMILIAYPLESLIVPHIFSMFFKELNDGITNEIIYKFVFYFSIFMGITNLAQTICSRLETIIIPNFNKYISNLLFQKIVYFYENNYADLELGKIVTRINSLPSIIRELTTDLITWIIPKIATLLIINIYFCYFDWRLGLVSFIFLLLICYYNFISYDACIELSNQRYTLFENKSEEIQDKLSNLYSIYSSNKINDEVKNVANTNDKFSLQQNKAMICSSKIKNNNNIFTMIFFIFILAFISFLYKEGNFTKEKIISLFLTITFYIPSLNTVITYLPDYTNHMGIIRSVNDYIKLINIDRIQKPELIVKKGKINIKNLTFGYTTDKQIFTNFNLDINPNEKIAIVGPSGNGKSTIIKLIMGYYKVPDGTIIIDDQDINKYSLSSLRKQVSYINQNTKLFNKTIIENIQYGNDTTQEQINLLIDKYSLQNIFKNLPNGFNTIVGVNGDSLSGGQKQIIQLLRLYNKQNKIIILDEPTSALDNETRIAVLKIINDISINSTLIVITHDEQNLNLVKKIIKLKEGKIVKN
jgi:ATP-binding cassette subfamily B protein/ATP-binding cassette subfamily B multidrug efflux pump